MLRLKEARVYTLLTTDQAAPVLGLSVTSVRAAIKKGALRCDDRTRGGHARIAAAEVERFRVASRRDASRWAELERQRAMARYLGATARAAATLASRLDVAHVLQTVVETLVADFDAALARVWLYEDEAERNILRLRASAGSVDVPNAALYRHDNVTTSSISMDNLTWIPTPVVYNDLASEPRFDGAWATREGIVAMAALPLTVAGEPRGMLVHYSRQAFVDEAVDALTTFAAIVAAALSAVDLLAREQEVRTRAEASAAEASAQARRLALVQETARELAITSSVQDLCEKLTQAIYARMDRHIVGVFLRQGDELRLIARCASANAVMTEPLCLPLGVGIVRQVAATKQSYLCRDTRVDPHLYRSADMGTRAELAVPIRAGADLVGVLNVESPCPDAFDHDDVATLEAIADQAAIAIQNARLYEMEADLRRRAEARARRIEHVQRVGEWLKMDLDEREVGARVVAAAREALGFRMAVLNLVDRPGEPDARLRVVATAGLPPEGEAVLTAHDYPLSDVEALFREEFRLSRSYFIPEGAAHISTATDIPTWTPALANVGPNAWRAGDELLVPLTDRQGGHLLGFLSVDDPESGRRPEHEEVEVLEIFADQAVVALRNACLLAEARWQAERDPVTGLLNHRGAHARLMAALAAAQSAGAALGLLALDMDGFKLINDTHGHPVGDRALRHVAGLLDQCTRTIDLAARLGGDEFLLILPGANRSQSVEVAHRLSGLAQQSPLYIEGIGPLPLRLSIGVAAYPDDAAQPHALLAVADARLYDAKRAGGRAVEAGRDAPAGGRRDAEDSDLAGFDMLSALVTALDNKDRYTAEHSEQVALFACNLAEALGLSPDTQRTLRVAGLLHDVGKIGVPDRVLRKPGKLEPDEWEAMKQHVALSTTLVRAVVPDPDVLAAVAHHHERWDGKGYPRGLAGAEVPLLGRIMIVADAVSAMAMDLPYRRGLTWDTIVAELRMGAGAQFDPALIEPFIAALGLARRDVA